MARGGPGERDRGEDWGPRSLDAHRDPALVVAFSLVRDVVRTLNGALSERVAGAGAGACDYEKGPWRTANSRGPSER
ncbi:hypothetical protein ACQPZG_23425 [Streptomyces sp. CA-294286]|uniref:hypothetical protein n=1 Tax=Streptomyces sp. CA-294286 TaxID=3240070 RepID=UPI003D8E7560